MSNSPRGFTLVETMIYLGIIVFMITALVSFTLSISNTRNKTSAIQEVQANARVALSTISGLVRAADDINANSSTFGADPGALSLGVDPVAENPTIIRLNQDDGVLEVVKGLGSAVAITTKSVRVTHLLFTLVEPGNHKHVRVEFVIEYIDSTDPNIRFSQSYQTAVSLREE